MEVGSPLVVKVFMLIAHTQRKLSNFKGLSLNTVVFTLTSAIRYI